MKTKRIIKGSLFTGLTAIAVLAILAVVFVGCGRRGYHSTPEESTKRLEWFSGKIADRLDLTTDQKSKVEGLLTELHEKRGESRDWHQSVRQDMLALVRREKIGQDDINRVVETHRQQMDEMIAFAGDRVIEFHALLTPVQREKLAKEIENHRPGDRRHCRFKKW